MRSILFLLHLLFMIPPLDHLSEFALCAHKLRTVVTHNQRRLSSDSEKSSQRLHKFNGSIIYSQLQVYSSPVHARKDYSIMLGGCVLAYLHFVRPKVITCCVMKWGRERFQASSGQVSHELCFSSCLNFSAVTHWNFTDLAKSCALMIQNFVLIFTTVVATPACPI